MNLHASQHTIPKKGRQWSFIITIKVINDNALQDCMRLFFHTWIKYIIYKQHLWS